MLDFRVVIPARYASSRLPGKVLLKAGGKEIIRYVYENACASAAGQVIIATDDRRIFECAHSFDAEVRLTSGAHRSGTDRIAEVVCAESWDDAVIVVNVQGDEPMMPPANIDQVARNLADRADVGMATLCMPLAGVEEHRDPNVVKVVRDDSGMAITFARNLEGARGGEAWRHLGIYAYRVGFLRRFVGLPASEAERRERLEQLRALGQGEAIHCDVCASPAGVGVDTREDYLRFVAVVEQGGDLRIDV